LQLILSFRYRPCEDVWKTNEEKMEWIEFHLKICGLNWNHFWFIMNKSLSKCKCKTQVSKKITMNAIIKLWNRREKLVPVEFVVARETSTLSNASNIILKTLLSWDSSANGNENNR
jgi:hypothetical protein